MLIGYEFERKRVVKYNFNCWLQEVKEWSCHPEMQKPASQHCGEDGEFILEMLILRCLFIIQIKILGR